jgi:GT2 family glycosyltransferase
MKIFAIIITFNPRKWLDKCLNSLRSSDLPLSIVIIDNASTDNCREYIIKEFPEVKYIQSEINLGFGKANNIGIKYALENNADYIFLLNQDAWVYSDTLQKLIHISKQNKQYGILSPLHLNGSETALDYKFSMYLAPHSCPSFLSDLSIKNKLNEIYNCSFINAACWLMPANIFEIVGGFDPIFFHYGEDDNYCQRVLYHGFKIGLVPIAKIVHDRLQEYIPISKYSSINEYDKYCKINLANINNDFDKSYQKKLSDIKSKIYLSLLSLNFNRLKFWIPFYKHLINSKPIILNSYKSNIIRTRSYLN